ncbi:uncharacterized protein LOC128989304 [Macrosteles quadrilineatus]|uniref:uncharacterized protein LOC128989304 n=1 Tax=Macrosteles quadrilineatus TaxID=74068 RepID=UPI0023E283B2|nr:uncharacterized protein LOC128989304 [Macrosteles quadrilineatus]
MLTRSVCMTILLLVLTGVVKAHIHFLRLVVLALAGLAGMYMVHLLANDWTKIRPNRPSAGRLLQSALQGISKRSIPDAMLEERVNEIPSLEAALHQDPLGCARKLVCALAARPSNSLSREEVNILAMIRVNVGRRGAKEFREAEDLGAKSRREAICDQKFNKCFFSSRQLVKILRSF